MKERVGERERKSVCEKEGENENERVCLRTREFV